MQESKRFVDNSQVVLTGLHSFLDDPECRQQVLDILGTGADKRRRGLSMRYLEWIATTHARERVLRLADVGPSGHVPTDVHTSYKQQLARWSKMHFDPFAREQKLQLQLGGVPLQTSVGQLNFLRWAIESGVVAYAKSRQQELRQEITRRTAASRERARTGVHKPRTRRTLQSGTAVPGRLYVQRDGFVLEGLDCSAPVV